MTCLCDRELRCTECHGCECRPGDCVLCVGTPSAPRRQAAWKPPRDADTYRRAAQLTDDGWSTQQIAIELGIATRTVTKWRRKMREAA